MTNRVKVYGRIDRDLFEFIELRIDDYTFHNWSHALQVIVKEYKERNP